MNLSSLSIESVKEFCELVYWKLAQRSDKQLRNDHYKEFYTSYFDLDESFYTGKAIMDIGCGPRGSLEWANMTTERIGLDPLAEKYLKMGASKHKMTYVKAYVEDIPFDDNHFDVICSFNSLDHVKNIEESCKEIKRVLKPGGLFLLVVDIHKYPTFTEPQCLNWSFLQDHFSDFHVLEEKHLENAVKRRIYSNLRTNKELAKGSTENGVLVAKIQKPD
ncbi:MAG: class I SAM-dependent methyltransferase [Bacteroidetes bacterium]|nr:MAG: class I SAM-dependent methyltransferase [Bacteroidota bacterium]